MAAEGGQRWRYRPVELAWCARSEPVAVVEAMRRRYRVDTVYVADLDAIEGRRAAIDPTGLGRPLWFDAGVRTIDQLRDWEKAWPEGVTLVAGLETLACQAALGELTRRFGPDRLVLSLDLRGGRPVAAAGSDWPSEPLAIVRAAVALGIRQILVLDLGAVGRGGGLACWAVPLLERFRGAGLAAEWFVGGGLHSVAEIEPLEAAGYAGVLVGSALRRGDFDSLLGR